MKITVTKSLLTLGILMTCVMTLSAQQARRGGMKDGPGKGARFEQRIDSLRVRLNLNAEQEKKIRAIMKNSREEAKTIRESTSSPEDRKPKMQALAKKTDDAIRAVLDPAQLELFRKYKEEQKAKLKERKKEDKELRMEMDEYGIL